MRTWLLTSLAMLIAFFVGVAVGVGGIVYLRDTVLRPLVPEVHVTGVVMFEENADSSASALPPEGYYVEAGGIERVYIDHGAVGAYVGRSISASGPLEVRCGPDNITCYPEIEAVRLSGGP